MRFAWHRKNAADPTPVKLGWIHPFTLLRLVYNAVFWIFLLPFVFEKIDYGTGFMAFAGLVLVRLALNLYTNNLLKPSLEQFERYPFRIP